MDTLRPCRIFGAAALMLLACTTGGQAQRIDPDLIFDLHINAEADNQSFTGSVQEGGRFNLTFRGVGAFALTPVASSTDPRKVTITVYRGAVGAEPETFRVVETVHATVGVPAPVRSMPRVTVVIDGLRRAPRAQAAAVPVAFTRAAFATPRSLLDGCCVTCGRVTACGCAVSSECGSCCVMPCCKPQPTSAPRYFDAPVQFTARRPCGNPIRDEERVYTRPAGATRVVASR